MGARGSVSPPPRGSWREIAFLRHDKVKTRERELSFVLVQVRLIRTLVRGNELTRFEVTSFGGLEISLPGGLKFFIECYKIMLDKKRLN